MQFEMSVFDFEDWLQVLSAIFSHLPLAANMYFSLESSKIFAKTRACMDAQILSSILPSHWQRDWSSMPKLTFPLLRTLMVKYTGEVRLTVKTRTHGSLHGTHSFWLHEVIWEPVNPCYSLPLQRSLVQNEEVWLHSGYNIRDQISTWLLSHETNSWGNLPS